MFTETEKSESETTVAEKYTYIPIKLHLTKFGIRFLKEYHAKDIISKFRIIFCCTIIQICKMIYVYFFFHGFRNCFVHSANEMRFTNELLIF